MLRAGVSAWFDAPSQVAGAELVGRIAQLVDGNGLPDVELRASGLRVRIGDSPDPSRADLDLAVAISAAAKDLGLAPVPAALQTMQFVVDAGDSTAVMSFWRTVLDYEGVGADGLEDPLRRDPAFSFRPLDQPRPLRNRIHVDVCRAPEAVVAIKAKLGQETYGAYDLTLADDEGNEVDLVPGDELSDSPGTEDWRVLFGAMTFYPTTSADQASRLTAAVAALADEAGVPVLVDLRPDGVTIDSGKDQQEDDVFGRRLVDLAARIQTAARDLGLSADPTRLRFVQLGIDAVDVPAVQAFWTTVLGYQHDTRPFLTDIYDPRRLNPVIIFQQLDASDEARRRQRNRIHLDLVVPTDQAESHIDAALAAGGRILSRDPATRCTLADPESNELTITTHPT